MRNFLICSILGVLLVATVSHQGYAQIPNSGFESWTVGNPDLWSGNNSFYWTPITQSADAHSGLWAAAGTVVTFSAFNYLPILLSATSGGRGFSVSSRHPALHGWCKYVPVGGDFLNISVLMSKGGNAIGAGGAVLDADQSIYKEFVANINYATADVPDTCYITVSISGYAGSAQVGSAFVMDDLAFGALATGVEASGNVVPAVYELSQNYPNPFNPATLIEYSIPHAGRVRLQVFNLLGKEVATLVDEQQGAGTYKARFEGSALASGTYFYRLQSDGFSQTKKFLLVK